MQSPLLCESFRPVRLLLSTVSTLDNLPRSTTQHNTEYQQQFVHDEQARVATTMRRVRSWRDDDNCSTAAVGNHNEDGAAAATTTAARTTTTTTKKGFFSWRRLYARMIQWLNQKRDERRQQQHDELCRKFFFVDEDLTPRTMASCGSTIDSPHSVRSRPRPTTTTASAASWGASSSSTEVR